ncbi:hypothetical protein E4O00_00950 [Treponema sp. OMZ 788]|uniref:hypothetical protein n=1 Tax=Treponema sp. OMZ 788 TaxID=2563664 RepID=UPI0020A2AB6C|nr:hypothetical protein [Treponema sp. OMZ 788]UTC64829.1 hypothetical protein E4O00_00950 [Treponema sp. OMZ 788]
MTRNYIKNSLAVVFILTAFIFINSCQPAIGTPWYPRASSNEPRKLYITEIKVLENPVSPFLSEQPADEADKLKKFVEAKEFFVNVSPSIEEIVSENIKVKAVSSLSTMEEVAVTVEINGEGVPLIPGKAIPVTIKIKDTNAEYGEVTKIIKITQDEPFDLKLESLTIAGENAMGGSVTLPYKKSMISAADIKAEFSYGTEKSVIPVVLERNSIELKEDESIDVKISVKALKGQYKDFENFVSVTREKRSENEDAALEPIEIYVQGIKTEIGKEVNVPVNTTQITEEDIIVVFKTFDDLPVKLTPNPITFESSEIVEAEISVPALEGKYLGWSMKFTVRKNAAAVYNPVDKSGNKKYVVKVNTITEEIDPFVYYDKDYDFSASKFDEWVVYIDAFNNSNNIASYKFKPDSWSGSPDQYAGPDFGSGLKAMGNVKFYRYKSRQERWGSTPLLFDAEKEKRFYFYRFTASGGVSLDNSMFCVDTHSKFLFYYSDPASISGVGVPSGWTDYAEPSSGSHQQFDEPFYLSDPVGFVKEDGQVVLYSWIKENITNNNYTAQKNPAFTKPAEKKASGAGFSPYRNKVITKKTEVVTAENPAYSLAQPLILAQPKTLRIPINSAEDAVMTVKTAPVPTGEGLSYQWYKNTEQLNEDGVPIPNADSPAYHPDKTVETNCYVYCEVTNTNSFNGHTDTVKTDAVKLLIKPPHLLVTDAALPKIIKQPEGKIIPINTSGTITLTAEAVSIDMGQISYQWYQNTEDNNQTGQIMTGETSASITVTVPTSEANKYYYYCLVTNTNDKVDGLNTAIRISNVVKVEVQELYPLGFKVNNENAGRIIALRDGKPIELGSYVKKGDKIQFLAFCNTDYETQAWEGAAATGNINLAEITINSEEDAKNTVCDMAYIPPGKLTVTAKKLKNTGFGYKSTFIYDGYFVHDFRIYSYYDSEKPETFTTIWEKYQGKKIPIWKETPVTDNAHHIYQNYDVSSDNLHRVKYEYFKLDTELIHYRGKYSAGSAKYYPTHESILSGYKQSLLIFEYNRQSKMWECITSNNFSIPNVNVQYDSTFKLSRGETKDFVIKYSYTGEIPGSAEVTYTLKWE